MGDGAGEAAGDGGLRARREALGLGADALADALGVSRTTLWRWESRKAPPRWVWVMLDRVEADRGAAGLPGRDGRP